MNVTVTIHSGELKQIKRLIKSEKKKNSANGQLYGLWTHSNQPVVQYVIGDSKGGGDVTKSLWENHGLRHVGSWSTKELQDDGVINGASPPSFVNMTVELLEDGKIMTVKLGVIEKDSKLNGTLETLEGQSAFRLKSPFSEQGDQKLQKRYYAPPEDGSLDVRDLSPKPSHREAETHKDQWYSTEEGMQLFGKIHGVLKEHFEVRPSRDTETHDLCLFLESSGRGFAVNFPCNFPHDSAILIRDNNRKEAIRLTKASSKGGKAQATKDNKPPKSAKGGEKAQDKDVEGNVEPLSAQDEEKDKVAEANANLDSGEIPKLLYQEIHRLMFESYV